jgi:hypothetical protein
MSTRIKTELINLSLKFWWYYNQVQKPDSQPRIGRIDEE